MDDDFNTPEALAVLQALATRGELSARPRSDMPRAAALGAELARWRRCWALADGGSPAAVVPPGRAGRRRRGS